MAGEFVRQDIWTLEQQQPWHRVTMAYALAVREMRRRDAEDPTSWAYQTAVHWTDVRNPGPFRDQCQVSVAAGLARAPWRRAAPPAAATRSCRSAGTGWLRPPAAGVHWRGAPAGRA